MESEREKEESYARALSQQEEVIGKL